MKASTKASAKKASTKKVSTKKGNANLKKLATQINNAVQSYQTFVDKTLFTELNKVAKIGEIATRTGLSGSDPDKKGSLAAWLVSIDCPVGYHQVSKMMAVYKNNVLLREFMQVNNVTGNFNLSNAAWLAGQLDKGRIDQAKQALPKDHSERTINEVCKNMRSAKATGGGSKAKAKQAATKGLKSPNVIENWHHNFEIMLGALEANAEDWGRDNVNDLFELTATFMERIAEITPGKKKVVREKVTA